MAPEGREGDDALVIERLQGVLRYGDTASTIAARAQLAAIYERAGLLEQATDLVIANIRAGARDGASFLWLARLYRDQGHARSAVRAEVEAAKYLPLEQSPSQSERARTSRGRGRAVSVWGAALKRVRRFTDALATRLPSARLRTERARHGAPTWAAPDREIARRRAWITAIPAAPSPTSVAGASRERSGRGT